MDEQIHDRLKAIKKELRLSMNGPASTAMRERGLQYKVNFGVELPRLKVIAATLEPSHELAQALWKEEIRECKILATMIQPAETFYEDIADIWLSDINNIELVEQATMNLFSRLPYAPSKAFVWIADDRDYVQSCGFLLAARLFGQGYELNRRAIDEFLDQAEITLKGEKYFPKKEARVALMKFAAQNKENEKKVTLLLGF
jgi:3-methyladenine DNA glycosylase AlkD